MEALILILVLLAIAAFIIFDARRIRSDKNIKAKPDTGSTQASPVAEPAKQRSLLSIAQALEKLADRMAQPPELREHPDFQELVSRLSDDTCDGETVVNYAIGSNWVLRCAACTAFTARADGSAHIPRVAKDAGNMGPWPLIFMLDYIENSAGQAAVVTSILARTRYWWPEDTRIQERLARFIKSRIDAGEKIEIGPMLVECNDEVRNGVYELIKVFPAEVAEPLRRWINEYRGTAIDHEFLSSVGEFIGKNELDIPVFETEQLQSLRSEFSDELASNSPRSVIVVGEAGVGKSSVRREFAKVLRSQGWHVFKTSAANLIAEKIYIGQIEGQIRKLAQNASIKKRVALFVEGFVEFSEFGRHDKKNASLLDQLWPSIERREVFLISETTAEGLLQVSSRYPSLTNVARIMQVHPATESQAETLARQLLDHLDAGIPSDQQDDVVDEALQLSQQYLSHKALPGSVLSLLELAVLRAQREEATTPNRQHLLAALSQVSGLPIEVLDDKQQLNIEAIREAFTRRVIGQEEAVECLVERIAMLKAGLTDPARPIGVFLFAGPTGTGKTEIAKRLADLIFGSPEQMIRLDMSEFQTADSTWRLIGQSDSGTQESLANRIRKQPFSVVLLDEFEKAHPNVWDVFLQVFDDGRLTDSKGALADFRHSIIILTSNLGSKISSRAGLGFSSRAGEFSKDDVLQVIQKTFRPEFVNRLDRVVVFQPLSREVMRAILRKELKLLLNRRGLRTRPWAVEYEDSAIEFLLEKGFTADLGARPLRRAIEQHLLAPLSFQLVQNEAPGGEQFMFIRSDGEALQVEFENPDASEPVAPDQRAGSMSVEALILASSAPDGARDILTREAGLLNERIENEEFAEIKAALLSELNHEDFWARTDRLGILDRIELADRIEAASATLASRINRLNGGSDDAALVRQIANRIYVLKEGIADFDQERPTQAIIGIRLVSDDANEPQADEFLLRMIQMYRNWAEARGMNLRDLQADDTSRYAAMYSVSGFGSYGILAGESGVHVLEVPSDGNRFNRVRVRVKAAPLGAGLGRGERSVVLEATRTLDDWNPGPTTVVRRYRQEPAPLVRDGVRGWRTGRIDRVFEGHFDVLSDD